MSFSVSVGLLMSSYKRLQKKLHPDKFAQASKVIKATAADHNNDNNSSSSTHQRVWPLRATVSVYGW